MIVKVRDYRKAGILAWLGLSFIVLLVLGICFVLSPASAREFLPACDKKASGEGECVLCGITTSFMHVARGDLTTAREAHSMGAPLFFMLLLNEIACLCAIALRGRALLGRRENHADC